MPSKPSPAPSTEVDIARPRALPAETGLVLTAEELASLFSQPAVIVVEDDLGPEWDFQTAPVFQGVYLGADKEVDMSEVDTATGEIRSRTSHLYGFTSLADGLPYCVWGTYAIDRFMHSESHGPVRGDAVYIEHIGKVDGKGGKTLNRFRLAVLPGFTAGGPLRGDLGE